jgi:type VI protein secretion system component Hcp
MADHFDFRTTKNTDPEETYLEYKLDGVMIKSYHTSGSAASKDTSYDEDFTSQTAPDFVDDFIF